MSQNFFYKDAKPDPILTSFAVQYGTGGGFVADIVAPVVNVASPNFKVPTYKVGAIDDDIATKLGPRDGASEISRYAPTFAQSAANRYALKAAITREIQLAGMGPLGSEQATTAEVTGKLRLGVEKRLKTLLDSAGTAASAPSPKWDAASATIEKNLDAAREAFLLKSGFEANVALIPPDVAKAMKRDSTIRDLRKYTDPSLLVNGDLPPVLFGLNVVIPGALQNTANPGAAQSVARIWNADTVYLLYVDRAISGNGAAMTAAAQFRWGEWGPPYAAYQWADPDPTVKVTWVGVELYQVEALVCGDAVYRIPDVLT